MTNKEFIRLIFRRIFRFKILLIIGGILGAVALALYARRIPPVYTARATVFPLNSTPDNSAATSALTSMLGLSETPKSFSQDASINIVELAQSRNTREAVALRRLPGHGNKRIGEILIEHYNRTKPALMPAIKISSDTLALGAAGGNLLKNDFAARTTKNGILEITYSSKDPSLVTPISYKFIEKISEFYKDLKRRKAQLDYDFTLQKIDSLDKVLTQLDRKAVHMANTTLFVASDKVQFQVPKENLATEKQGVQRQRDASVNNREEALWRLQKVTPIIAVLDEPTAPFDIQRPSVIAYGGIGFVLGSIVVLLLCISDLFYKYIKAEAKKAIFGEE